MASVKQPGAGRGGPPSGPEMVQTLARASLQGRSQTLLFTQYGNVACPAQLQWVGGPRAQEPSAKGVPELKVTSRVQPLSNPKALETEPPTRTPNFISPEGGTLIWA